MNIFKQLSVLAAKDIPFLFLVDYERSESVCIPYPKESSGFLYWKVGDVGNDVFFSSDYKPGSYFSSYPIRYEEYVKKFRRIQDALLCGNTFLANLTVKTPIDTDYSLEEIFARSTSRYKVLWQGRFVCFSPETFVKIEDNKIKCYPMKGTISATVPDAQRVILSDYKETCEHNTIVDFIRSDLARVGRNVRVERYRYIDRLDTSNGPILQVSSEVVADLEPDWKYRIGEILDAILPAGSICGAPRKSTLEAIRSAEKEKRGFYTGIMGYFDGERFESAVLIRYIEKSKEGNRQFFRSGGGITINSDCAEEYNEVLEKVYLPF